MASPDQKRAAGNIAMQVYAALDAAHIENGYPHDFSRDASDVVLEIHDWSGIEGFDPEFRRDMAQGRVAVREWRNSQSKT